MAPNPINRGRAPSKYVNKLAIGFYFFIPEVKQIWTELSNKTVHPRMIRTKYCVVIYSYYIMIILILLEITLNCKKLMITSIAEFSHSNRTTASRPS
jgi:hypothetical protein